MDKTCTMQYYTTIFNPINFSPTYIRRTCDSYQLNITCEVVILKCDWYNMSTQIDICVTLKKGGRWYLLSCLL